MFKRWFLFFGVNILIVVMLSMLASFLGIGRYTSQYGMDYQSLMVFCLFWGMAGSFISLLISKWMAKRAYGIQIVEENGQYGVLVRKVYMLSQKAGLPKMPEVGIYDSHELNAFATGPSKSNSLVAVSTGLLNSMNDDELEGVLAHEISHISNGDMVTMTLLQGVVNAFVMFLARVIAFAIDQAMRGSDDNEGSGLGGFAYFGVVIGLEISLGVLASFVTSWFSRFREFRADYDGAKLSSPLKMRSALECLEKNYGVSQKTKTPAGMAAFQISSQSRFLELLSTHPPLEKRIEALKNLQF